jgi:hypothetical protein
MALGAVFLVRTTVLATVLAVPAVGNVSPLLGWPDGRAHLAPVGPTLPPPILVSLCVARTVAALLFTAGVLARPAGLIAGLLGYLTVLQDPAGFNAALHVLFLGTCLLAVTDSASAIALKPAPAWSPTSSAWLLRVWVASIYLWSGVAKVNADWLNGRTLQLFLEEGAFRTAVAPLLAGSSALRSLVAHGLVVFEVGLAGALLWPRTRRAAVVAAVIFHAALEILVRPDLLGWAMAALLLACWGRVANERPMVRATVNRP